MRIVTPVRFVLQGDIERAKSHMNIARVMLGQMDARSSNPFMNWYRTLDDGTTMRLINNGGQRMAVIDSPIQRPTPEEPTAAAANGFGFLTEDGTWIYSVDRGVTWQAGTPMTIGDDFPVRPFVSLILPSGQTVCFVGFDDIFTLSADGTTWTNTGFKKDFGDGISNFTNAVDSDGEIIIAACITNTATQLDGIQDSFGWAPVTDLDDWTRLNASEMLSNTEDDCTSIAYGGAAGWVMPTNQGDVFVSPDGLTNWTIRFDGQALGFWATIHGAYRWNGDWYLYGRWFVAPSGRMIRKYDDDWNLVDTTALQFVELALYRPIGNSSILAMVDLVDSNTVSVRQSTDGETWTTALTRDLNNNQFAPTGSGVVIGEDILLTYSHIVSGVANYGVFVNADGVWTDVTDDVIPLIGSGSGNDKRIRTAVAFLVE